MIPWRRMLTVLPVLLALALVGCAPPQEEPAEDGNGDDETAEESPSVMAPGLYADGTHAVGTLVRFDLEGGFWALVDAEPGETPDPEDTGAIVAVIVNAEDVADVDELSGEYCIAVGELLEDGASIRMAGPEMEATSLDRVEDATQVEPDGGDV